MGRWIGVYLGQSDRRFTEFIQSDATQGSGRLGIFYELVSGAKSEAGVPWSSWGDTKRDRVSAVRRHPWAKDET